MSAAEHRLGAQVVLETMTQETKEQLLAEYGKRAPGSKSGFAGVIPIGNKFQARIWVAAKKKQQALPRLWDTAEEAALWLAYIKASGLPPPSPKKVKARSGELCPPQCVHMHCPSTLALVARLPAHRLH